MLAEELHSKPIKLNDEAYFVPDFRPETLILSETTADIHP